MGWFGDDDDDDDDDDEEEQKPKRKMMELMDFGFDSPSSGTRHGHGPGPGPGPGSTFLRNDNDNDNNDNSGVPSKNSNQSREDEEKEEEEEDPLDAYMKSLEKSSLSAATGADASNQKKKSHQTPSARLDMENEDEATSHWQVTTTTNSSISSSTTTKQQEDEEGEDEDEEESMTTRNAAATALEQMFHKATSTGSSSRQVDIQLEPVQHASMGYAPFQKNLLRSTTASASASATASATATAISSRAAAAIQNTPKGHDWRREHSISCHPPLDPIYDFAELRNLLSCSTSNSTTDSANGAAATGGTATATAAAAEGILEWIAQQPGMTQPTLVQSQTLSVALNGLDAIVTASTGSGKTLAYLFPLVAHLMANNRSSSNDNHSDSRNTTACCRALVLVPTRELALQVEKVAKSLLRKVSSASAQSSSSPAQSSSFSFSALAITGGNLGRYQLSQTLLQRKPHLIVATPGRLLDVLNAQQKSKQTWLLQEITFLVLDEADKMLQMGFAGQVTQLLENLRPDRQSLLTSATMHGRLEQTISDKKWMRAPITRISIGRSGTSSEHVQQHVVCLPSVQAKQAFLKESLPTFCQVGRTIVFCATREGCEQLAQFLITIDNATGTTGTTTPSMIMPALQTLHGDKHPSDRKAALKAFAKGETVKLLIATDVAGRGLDIPQVTTVINYDPAKNWDTHVHRIGRAGRLNSKDINKNQQQQQYNEGSAYTLLTPANAEFAQTLVQAYQREGREIGADVQQLANHQHQHYRSSSSRDNNNNNNNNMGGRGGMGRKGGLGFTGSSAPSSGEASSSSRPWKKSRWS